MGENLHFFIFERTTVNLCRKGTKPNENWCLQLQKVGDESFQRLADFGRP